MVNEFVSSVAADNRINGYFGAAAEKDQLPAAIGPMKKDIVEK